MSWCKIAISRRLAYRYYSRVEHGLSVNKSAQKNYFYNDFYCIINTPQKYIPFTRSICLHISVLKTLSNRKFSSKSLSVNKKGTNGFLVFNLEVPRRLVGCRRLFGMNTACSAKHYSQWIDSWKKLWSKIAYFLTQHSSYYQPSTHYFKIVAN